MLDFAQPVFILLSVMIWKTRITALLLLILGGAVGFFVVNTQDRLPFHLGLDLSGGSHLVYRADVDSFAEADVDDAVESLRDVIERRVNLFGVGEPLVQSEVSRLADGGKEHRLIVELPGVTDIDEAIDMIGQTPLLEFKLRDEAALNEALQIEVGEDGQAIIPDLSEVYVDTGLTGRFLQRANLTFSQGVQAGGTAIAGEPIIELNFTPEGSDLFAEITGKHVGEVLAIFLDGAPISQPVIQDQITGGQAQISGQFTPDEAKQLVGRLNSGALPVPIELLSTETIGPNLGAEAVDAGVMAGIWGFALVGIFLILWYRIPGVLAVVALAVYAAVMLALFKSLPVTLTSAGIAGFIISLGIAVDANILIFERMKEELQRGQTLYDAIKTGFARAWASIRDANLSSLISAFVLWSFGTSLIRGFAVTFGLGVLVSMLTAITVTKLFLFALAGRKTTQGKRFAFLSGFLK